MILSLLHLDLVFYFSLGINETIVFIPYPFGNFPNGGPHPEARRERSCEYVTHHEEQLLFLYCSPLLLLLLQSPLVQLPM
jgi:hypothetical protein